MDNAPQKAEYRAEARKDLRLSDAQVEAVMKYEGNYSEAEIKKQVEILNKNLGHLAVAEVDTSENMDEMSKFYARERLEKEQKAHQGIAQILMGRIAGSHNIRKAKRQGATAEQITEMEAKLDESQAEKWRGEDGLKRGMKQVIKDTFKYNSPLKVLEFRKYVDESLQKMRETGNIFAGSNEAEIGDGNEAVAERFAQAEKLDAEEGMIDTKFAKSKESFETKEKDSEETGTVRKMLRDLAGELNGIGDQNSVNYIADEGARNNRREEALRKYKERVEELRAGGGLKYSAEEFSRRKELRELSADLQGIMSKKAGNWQDAVKDRIEQYEGETFDNLKDENKKSDEIKRLELNSERISKLAGNGDWKPLEKYLGEVDKSLMKTSTDNLLEMGQQLTCLTEHTIATGVLDKYFDQRLTVTLGKAEVGTKTKEVTDKVTAMVLAASAGGLGFAEYQIGKTGAKSLIKFGVKNAVKSGLGVSLTAGASAGISAGLLAGRLAWIRAKKDIANDTKKRVLGGEGDAKKEKLNQAGFLNADETIAELEQYFKKDAEGKVTNELDIDNLTPEKKEALLNKLIEVDARLDLSRETGKDLFSNNDGMKALESARTRLLVLTKLGVNGLGKNGLVTKEEADQLEARTEDLKDELDQKIRKSNRAQTAYKLKRAVASGTVAGLAAGSIAFLRAGGAKELREFVENGGRVKTAADAVNESMEGSGQETVDATAQTTETMGVVEQEPGAPEYGGASNVEVFEDEYNPATGNMTYGIRINGQEVIAGEAGDGQYGVEFDQVTGKIIENDAYRQLQEMGFEIQDRSFEEPVQIVSRTEAVAEYFSDANPNITMVTHRTWEGVAQAGIRANNITVEGESIVMQVTPENGSDINLDDLQLLLTPNGLMQNSAIALDVGPDGTVTIPLDSPAASLFDVDGAHVNFVGKFGELAQSTGDGSFNIVSTTLSGAGSVTEIQIPGESTVRTVFNYALVRDGIEYSNMNISGDISNLNADFGSLEVAAEAGRIIRDTGEPAGYNALETATRMYDSNGNEIRLDHFERFGGYQETADIFHGKVLDNGAELAKDASYAQGTSIIKEMQYDDYLSVREELTERGMSGDALESAVNSRLDSMFLEKVNSGEIDQGDVIELWMRNVGSSAENLTTTRSMLGDNFGWDWNGDGTISAEEIIDTQDEINAFADLLAQDPEMYNEVAKETFSMIYERLEGGSVRFIDYTRESYDFTTWAREAAADPATGFKNILQVLARKKSGCNGVGIELLDKDGKTIYDIDVVRKLWNLPKNYNLEHVSERLNCVQKTGRGTWVGSSSQQQQRKDENEGTTKSENETTKREDETTKREDETTKREDETTKREDETTKREDETTKREDETTKREDETTKREDETTKTEPEKTEREKTEREDTDLEPKNDNGAGNDDYSNPEKLPTTPGKDEISGGDTSRIVEPEPGNQTNPDVPEGAQVVDVDDGNSAGSGDLGTPSGQDTTAEFGDRSDEGRVWQGDTTDTGEVVRETVANEESAAPDVDRSNEERASLWDFGSTDSSNEGSTPSVGGGNDTPAAPPDASTPSIGGGANEEGGQQ